MSWVYPLGEAVQTTRLGIAAAFVWTGTAFLVAGAAEVVIGAVDAGHSFPWLALGGFALATLALIVARRLQHGHPTVLALTVVAAAVASWLVATGETAAGIELEGWGAFPLFAVAVAAALTGAMADRWTGAIGTLIGFAAAQAAIVLAAPDAAPFPALLEPAALAVAVGVAVFHALHGIVRRRARASGARMDAVTRLDLEATERRALRRRSRALMHDTVLGDLTALGVVAPGPLSEAMRTSILSSLTAARSDAVDREVEQTAPAVVFGELLGRFRVAGLRVTVTGDPATVDALAGEIRLPLLHAIEQCLVNVMQHSGVDTAEVSVACSGSLLVVTVVDEGTGFDENSVAADRFGLRESVRGRIQSLGGTVRVLSGSGSGTSVIIGVPVSEEAP